MSEHKKPEVESGQWNVDEGIGDEYQLKSIGNLSEENPIHDMKANTGDQKITFFACVEENINNYDISSYMHGNYQTIVLEAQEIDQSTVPDYNENTHHMTSGDCYNKDNISVENEQDDGVVSGDDVNDKIAGDHEQDVGVVSGYHGNDRVTEDQTHDDGVMSGDDGIDKVTEDQEHDDGVMSGDDGNDKVTEDQTHDDGVMSGDDGNDKVTEDQKHDDGVMSGDDGNDKVTEDQKHDDGVVSGDDGNDKVTDDQKHDDGVMSGDDGNDKVTEDQKHDDGVVSGDNDNDMVSEDHEHGVASGDNGNETVAEDYDNVNTFFVTDEEDMAFSFKNLFPCIRGKAKNKNTNPYQSMTNDKEKQPPIDPFRKRQSKFLKRTHELGISSHPPIETIKSCGVHNSVVIGASRDTSMQSGKTNSGYTHTGNVQFEDLRGREYIVNTRHEASIDIDPDQYNFSHPDRGYAVLIVNKNFSRLDARNGAEVDVQNTTMVLQKLGFIIKNEKLFDLDKQSALTVLRDAKYADHSKMDSFAFIISSHGDEIENPRNGKKEHAIYCSDDQYIFTNDILEMFSDENCPRLKGKPKLFFIQACRGNNTDSGVEIITVDGRNQNHNGVHNSSHHDGKNLDRVPHEPVMKAESDPHLCRVQIVDEMDAKGFEGISDERSLVHCNNDCLVMYAIPSGYFAWRSNMDGSWMLHYLWEEVKNYNFRKPCSFLKVLTAVNRKMANRETNVPGNIEKSGKKAIPVIIHQLDKDIVFQEKKPQDDGYTKAQVI